MSDYMALPSVMLELCRSACLSKSYCLEQMLSFKEKPRFVLLKPEHVVLIAGRMHIYAHCRARGE